jgi:formamidopyrimidine-DNA glycosylase
MPELPEVQTVVNSLHPKIINQKILSFDLLWNKTLYTNNLNTLKSEISKLPKIISINRHGKYIIIKLNNKFIVFHLRMTGYLYHSININAKSSYIRCFFTLSNNSYLIYEDIRKFGGFYYLDNLNVIFDKTGIDPMDINFSYDWISKNIKKRKKMIKSLLLDQRFICGIGNIYADEILWLSKIHPKMPANNINANKVNKLYTNILKILNNSIKYHGTTIINFKFDNMKTGTYKNQLKVYGRQNQNCKRCYNMIHRQKIAGRSTFFCKFCQKY